MNGITTDSPSSTSTGEQVRERVSDGAQQVQEKASEAKARVRERLREQVDTRSTETGERMTTTATALRQTAQRLRGDQQESQARLLEQIAERAERLGRYLTDTDGDRLFRDIERVGRGRPWVGAVGGAVLGFLAARFVKASSSRRYEANGGGEYAVAVKDVEPAPALPERPAVGVGGGDDGGDL
jgi:hypothetical protein